MAPLLTLNSEQQTAVNAREGYFACHAGPGSGKTAVITARYQALLAEGNRPEDILSLTFTKNAAAEMRKRAENPTDGSKNSRNHKVDGKETGQNHNHSGSVRPSGFLTFHSLALAFATQEREAFGYPLSSFPLATPGQAAKIAGEAARPYGLDYKIFRNWLSTQKNNGLTPAEARNQADDRNEMAMANAYESYENKCRAAGVLDFDSMLTEMVRILSRAYDCMPLSDESNLLGRWQYKWIQVDESQDANRTQWSLVKALSYRHENIFAAGDGNQAVYEWRGAHPDLFVHFPDMFPDAQSLYLGTNYRSTPQIVDFIKDAAPVRNELVERFQAAKPAGPEVLITRCADNQDEAKGVVRRLGPEKSAAVLARTNRTLAAFEEAFINAGIKYYLLGKAGFWSQREVQDVLAFCQCAVLPHDAAVAQALRSPFACTRFIRKTELLAGYKKSDVAGDGLLKYIALDPNNAVINFTQALRSLRGHGESTATDALKFVLSQIQAFEYFADEEAEDADNSPRENLEELVRISQRFENLRDFLEHARRAKGASRRKTGVALGTVHASKGKEFDTVFVVSVNQGLIPHKNGTPDEEKRIFFVACSRAARSLNISYWATPSEYLQAYIHERPEQSKSEAQG